MTAAIFFEHRTRNPLVLPSPRIVLLDGIVKKRDDIPASVHKRLRQLRSQVLAGEREKR